MSGEIKLTSILQRPIGEEHWPYLEQIIKQLNEYINQKVKNRDYVEAQQAKEKVIEANDEIRRRNRSELDGREKRAAEEMNRKHEQQKQRLDKQWEVKRRKIQIEYSQLIDRRRQKQTIQKEKHIQQIEIALPLSNSPDRELYHLRKEEEDFVQCGNFLEAQRVKMEIMKREYELNQKYQKVRQSNIRVMMGELENKQAGEILTLQAKREQKFKEVEVQRRKRAKELQQKQQRQIKQLYWIYGEQKKRFK